MIEMIQMKDCEGWKECVYYLAPGLNVIRSKNNNQGKSVLINFMKILANPKEVPEAERKKYIRRGAKFARIDFLFSDNKIGSMILYPRKVVYYFCDDIKAEKPVYDSTVDYPHPALLQELGLVISDTDNFIVNVMEGDSPIFLVKTDSKTNYSVCKELIEHKPLKRMIELTTKKLKTIDAQKARATRLRMKIEQQLQSFKKTDLLALKDNIELRELYIKSLKELLRVYEIIAEIEFKEDAVDYDTILAQLNIALNLKEQNIIDIDINDKDNLTDDLLSSLDLAINLNELLNNVNSVSIIEIDSSAESLLDTGVKVEEVLNLLSDVKIVDNLDYTEILDEMSATENIMDLVGILNIITNTTESCSKLKNQINNSAPLLNALLFLENVKDNILLAQNSITTLNQYKNEMKTLELKMEDLKENNTSYKCPIYGDIVLINNECIPTLEDR